MAKRILKEVKAIADAHIKADMEGTFDNPPAKAGKEVIVHLWAGKTFAAVLREIEIRYIPITSIVLSSTFKHQSHAYKAGVYKGFKHLLQP